MKFRVSRFWKILLLLSLVLGIVLRLIWTEDMEWKEDEYYNFIQSQLIGATKPWPWIGMPSGVYLANPGMSIWIFVWLARIFRATDPIELAHAVQIFALLGIILVLVFAFRFVKRSEREAWFWTFSIAMVNPFAVFYQRKLWPEPLLPAFSMLMLMGFWRRNFFWGAFVWGFFGAILGQIHMGGFFMAFALFLWTVLFNQRSVPLKVPSWKGWFAGSVVGALPLIPWALYLLRHPTGHPVSSGMGEALQFKFWVFWITDPLGLTLSNPLGLLRGNSIFSQISDFIRYPVIAGHATYLCAIAHVVVLVTGVWIIGSGLWRKPKRTESTLPQSSALWGFGGFMTVTGVNIRRYYMAASFPFEFLWLVKLALTDPRHARKLLLTLWAGELLISACFVGYVHVHDGATQGDYGEAYRIQRDRHRAQNGESWPDLKLLRD
jgi:hypothetical protein